MKRPRTHLLKVILGALAIALPFCALAAACGGSASESPWPVEPDNLVTGPEGEEKPPPRATPRDAGSDALPNVEP